MTNSKVRLQTWSSQPLRVGVAVIYTLLMAVLLLQPSGHPLIGPPAPPGPPDLEREIVLTTGHVVSFSLLTFLWWWALDERRSSPRILYGVVTFALIFGLATELAQSFIPGRGASTFDLATNWFVTFAAAWAIRRRWLH